MRFLRLAAALMLGAAVSTIGLTGCGEFFTPVGTSTVGNGTSSYVYVIHAGGTLAEYSLTSGALAALSGSPVTLTETPTSIVVAPNNAFVYIGTSSGAFVYTVNSSGTLTEGNSNNIAYVNPNGYVPQSMVVDPTSSWLIIAYQSQTQLDAVQISPTTGLPTGNVFSVTTSFADPTPQLAISPGNTQVFVALGTGGTEAFGFTPTGVTAPKGPWGSAVGINLLPNGGTADTAVTVDKTSKYLYVAEQNSNTAGALAGTVRVIGTGALGTDLDDEPTGIGPSAILADLTGAYVYVANGTDGTISGFSLNATTQKLASLGAAFPTEQSPIGLVEDSSKSYVMDVGDKANPNLWLYSFDASSLGSLDVGSTKSTATTNPALSNGIAVTH